MTYAVKRTYGKHGHDYLHAWCNKWGTACIGSIASAMKFGTKAEAEDAAEKAQRECKGQNGQPAQGITFTAVSI